MADYQPENEFASPPLDDPERLDTVSHESPITEPPPNPEPASDADESTRISTPQPPGSSASLQESIVPDSVADSIETATPSLGGSNQTQVNVVSRGFTPRPSTTDKPNHQFYANLPMKRPTDNDNESLISRSTAARTNFSSTMGPRRPPSRSHVPAIMPAYSFYHPLKPPAVASAAGEQQLAHATAEASSEMPTMTNQPEEVSSVHGKPSTEPLLPKPASLKQVSPLNPVAETTSNRTSMLSAHLMRPPATEGTPPETHHEKNGNKSSRTRNWQHFPGKTNYYLGGRVQFGSQYLAPLGILTLILIPTGLYFAFTYFLLLTPS